MKISFFFRRLLPFILLSVVAILYVRPYFVPGFFPTHDGEWAVVRLAEMQREVKDLQIPPRWSDFLNHGFGYPLFSFTYPFPFYMGLFFRFLGFGYVETVKLLFILSVILSAYFMFLLAREIAGNFAGFIAAIFYTVAPFRLVNLYVRGSLGESISLAIFPLLFYFGLKFIVKPNFWRLICCSITLAILILSHNIMALAFCPLFLFFLYFEIFTYYEDVRLYTFRYILPMFLLAFGLAAFFFLPAIVEKKFLLLSQIQLANLTDNFIKLPEFIVSSWDYGIKPSYQLGWAHLLAMVIGIVSIFFAKPIQRKKYAFLACYLIISIILLVVLTNGISEKLWHLPPLSWLDFPWRFLTPLAFLLALSSVFLSLSKPTKVIGLLLAAITVVVSLRFARPNEFKYKADVYYFTNDATTTSMDELMPLWVVDKPRDRYKDKVEIENGNATLANIKYNSKKIEFTVNSQEKSLVKINSIYFPGWEYSLNGNKIDPDYQQKDGLVRFEVDPGMYKVKGVFTETPLRLAADLISLASVSLIVVLTILFVIKRLVVKRA